MPEDAHTPMGPACCTSDTGAPCCSDITIGETRNERDHNKSFDAEPLQNQSQRSCLRGEAKDNVRGKTIHDQLIKDVEIFPWRRKMDTSAAGVIINKIIYR